MRTFLSLLSICLYLVIPSEHLFAKEDGLAKPNVLIVFSDDWGRYASCYRGIDGRPSMNDAINTPNVDRVAKEGVLFRNAFVNAPSCTPCRSSMLSGRYFFNTGRGAILNGAQWDSSIPTFPLMLKDAGYHIGKSYKVWSPGIPADAPFGGQRHAYEKAGRAANNYSEEVTARLAKGKSIEEAREELLAQVRGNFEDFLKARQPNQPWLYFFGCTTTHRVWVKGSGKNLWNIDPDSLKGKLPKFLPDVPEVREDVADYLGECQAVDAYIGALMQQLDASGEADRTVVVLSGDHGMPGVPAGKCNLYDMGVRVPLVIKTPGGKGGRIVDDLVCLPDLAPTMLELAGVPLPSGMNGRSLLAQLKSDQSGQIDSNRNWVITGRERHVAAAREGNLPYPMRAIRTSEYLYIRNFEPDRWPMGTPTNITASETPSYTNLENTTYTAYSDMDASPTKAWLVTHRNDTEWKQHYTLAFGKRPAEELYEISSDPDQVNNLAAQPAFAQIKSKLSQQLLDELIRSGDPRVVEEPPRFESSPFTDAK